MTGSVTINGTKYLVTIEDLTPADILPVFRTDTSILKTDSLLLHAAGTQQNSAKKVLLPHLVSMLSASVAEDIVLTIEPYYDENGVYRGMYWHYNSGWLRRTDTGEMIRVDDTAAEIALAAEQAVRATEAAKTATEGAIDADDLATNNENARLTAEDQRKTAEEERQQQEQTRQQQEQTRQQQEDNRVTEFASLKSASEQATSNANTAAGNANQKAQEANTARQNAQTAADEWNNTYKQQVGQAILDAQGADNLDASLDGMTVTITGRDGKPRSVSIGYEIYNTYETVAEMQADVANVPVGKFVIIATKDPTDPDNAKLYSRSSQGDFRFLADLDQASSAAWADWLENHKQQIADAISYALQQGDYAKAQGDYAKTQGDYAKTQGEAAEGIYNEVREWYGEDDQHGIRKTWLDWLADKLADWGAWKDARLADYNQWKSGLNTNFTEWFSDTLTTGIRYIWNTWFAARQQDWTNLERQASAATQYANEQGDWAKLWGDHPPRVNPATNYWQYYNPATEQYEDTDIYAKGDDLHYSEMTDAEKEALARIIISQLSYEPISTAGAMWDEHFVR